VRVVVTITTSECDAYPDGPCVMEVIGPFETQEEADAAAAERPSWTRPHVMIVRRD